MRSPDLLTRIETAKRAVLSQVELLHRAFGRAESKWKFDGSRVTDVDDSEAAQEPTHAQFELRPTA